MAQRYDAVVVGAGPNGLAAAAVLARHARSVLVIEAADEVGGGLRTVAGSDGFIHDHCSTSHPLGVTSPVLADLPLARHGLEWVHAPFPVAHPLDGGRAAVAQQDVLATAASLGVDEQAWLDLYRPFVAHWHRLAPALLGPIPRIPRDPVLLARFGLLALRSATSVADRLSTPEARALVAGNAAHGVADLDLPTTGAFAVVLTASAMAVGFPFISGGSQRLADAFLGLFGELGVHVETGQHVRALGDIPPSDLLLLDVTPRQLVQIAGDALPAGFRDRMLGFQHGAAAFKVDYELSGPVPWANPDVAMAGTVHLGGTLEEIALAEAEVAAGVHPERPFVLATQPSVADASRAPAGKHVLWTYTHVPNGSTVDMTDAIERQVERFAPGFRDLVEHRIVTTPRDFELGNPNFHGGDFAGGVAAGLQAVARPRAAIDPYATPLDGVYLCSASTPPGAGVHGMSGYHAARSALRAHDRGVRRTAFGSRPRALG